MSDCNCAELQAKLDTLIRLLQEIKAQAITRAEVKDMLDNTTVDIDITQAVANIFGV